jgi:hypothetical protein
MNIQPETCLITMNQIVGAYTKCVVPLAVSGNFWIFRCCFMP